MDIVGQQSWITKIEEQVKTFNPAKEEERWKKMSIYQIPEFSKELKEKAFTPQVTSFGPYHYGKQNLKLIEDYKQKVLVHFLKRAGKPLRDFVKAMEETVEDLQACYQGLQDTQWKDKYKFVRLMISDGCFMLEILRLNPDKPGDSGYTDHDPIFSVHGAHHKLPYIKRDMLMLENQIPLLVLKVLLQVEAGQTTKALLSDKEINRLVFKFCGQGGRCHVETLGLHVLDVCRQSMIQRPHGSRIAPPYYEGEPMFTAAQLRESGVRFKKSGTNYITDISFDNGVLTLPTIVVDDITECTLLNLMAFEHLHVGVGNEITSYVCFMNELVDTAKDVHLLHANHIIHSALGSNKAVAELFNSITKDIILDPNSDLGIVREEVNRYCKKRHVKWPAVALAFATVLLVPAILHIVYKL